MPKFSGQQHLAFVWQKSIKFRISAKKNTFIIHRYVFYLFKLYIVEGRSITKYRTKESKKDLQLVKLSRCILFFVVFTPSPLATTTVLGS